MTVHSLYEYKQMPVAKGHNFNALTIAQNELGTAFDRDQMRYKGRPIRLNDLMLEVNRLRVAAGREQVLYNKSWGVE